MLESNLNRKRNTSSAILSINFETAAVGSKTFNDFGTGRRTFTRSLIAGSAGNEGVVNHATFGKVYQFNGLVYFDCPDIIQHSNRDHRLEIDFVSQNKTRNNVLWRSGDFTAMGNRPGMLFVLNQDPANYIQAFTANGGGNWQRNTLPGANPGEVLEQVVITRSGSLYTMFNKRTGQTRTYSAIITGADNYLAVGVADDFSTDTTFIGYLKRLELFLT